MAFLFDDIAKMTWTGTGTGDFALSAASGFLQLTDFAVSGDQVPYFARNVGVVTEWEYGVGTFTSPSTLARTLQKRSSNSNNPVSFTAGTKEIWIGIPAEYFRPLFPIQYPTFYTDFLDTGTVQHPFTGAAVASGTLNAALAVGNMDAAHPGVVKIRSSTTANSGYKVQTGIDKMFLGGGEVFDLIFKTPAAFTNNTCRWGYHDTVASTDAVDGVYMELSSAGVLTGKTSNNSTRSSTASTFGLSVSTWYHARVTLNAALTQARFELFSVAGASLWVDTLTTNIPTTRETAAGVIGTNSGTTASDVLMLDFMSIGWDAKPLARGMPY